MPAIVYKKFSGEVPNVDPQLLAIDRAQYAQNCEFSRGSLKPAAGGFPLASTFTNNPIKGIYTEDGARFFTWTSETYAFRGPVIDDSYSRVYLLQPSNGTLKVTTTAEMSVTGPSPTQLFNVGVPRPAVAPTLALVERTSMVDYPGASVSIESWWEYAGKVYEQSTISPSSSSAFRWYDFATPPKTPQTQVTQPDYTDPSTGVTTQGQTITTGSPSDSVLVVKLKISQASGAEILSMTLREGQSSRSAALPGGVEASMSKTSTGYRVALTWGTIETRAYVYTCTNTWGEEGAPSPPSTISVNYLQDVSITVTAPVFTNYKPLQGYKVYRTYGTGTSYLQTDVTGSAPTFTDSAKGARAIGSALASINWTPAPVNLKGLALMPNGWFAAHSGNMLYMSEPFRPHAWPYSITFSKPIRGIAVAQQSLVVTTADGVHVVTGAFPGSAQSIRLNLPQAGVSQRAMTSVDGSVIYASNDGLVFVAGADASMTFSQNLFYRQNWRDFIGNALSDGSLVLGYHDGCIVGTSKTQNKGFTIRMDEGTGDFSRLSIGYDAMFILPLADTLYYSINSSVYQFKGGDAMTYDWWGKDWVFQSHATFGAGYLRASGAVTLTIYADGSQVYSASISPGHFRLPSLPRALRWSIRLSGTREVFEFAMAQTMSELKNV